MPSWLATTSLAFASSCTASDECPAIDAITLAARLGMSVVLSSVAWSTSHSNAASRRPSVPTNVSVPAFISTSTAPRA